jgi:hypothetical protein
MKNPCESILVSLIPERAEDVTQVDHSGIMMIIQSGVLPNWKSMGEFSGRSMLGWRYVTNLPRKTGCSRILLMVLRDYQEGLFGCQA